MIKEEYKKLLALLEASKDAKNFNLEELLKEAVRFFEQLRSSFPTAPKEQRQEMVEMMSTLHGKIQEISKTVTEASGMTEEELYAYSENPSNFTPEQWRLVQDTRKDLYDSARKLSQAINEQRKAQAGPGSETPIAHPRPIRGPTKRAKRSEWKKT